MFTRSHSCGRPSRARNWAHHHAGGQMQTIDAGELSIEHIGSTITYPSTVEFPKTPTRTTGKLLSINHGFTESQRGVRTIIEAQVVNARIQFVIANDKVDVHAD